MAPIRPTTGRLLTAYAHAGPGQLRSPNSSQVPPANSLCLFIVASFAASHFASLRFSRLPTRQGYPDSQPAMRHPAKRRRMSRGDRRVGAARQGSTHRVGNAWSASSPSGLTASPGRPVSVHGGVTGRATPETVRAASALPARRPLGQKSRGPRPSGAGGTERGWLQLASQQGGDEEGDYQEKQIQTNEDEKASTHAIDDTCPCAPQPHRAHDETDSSDDDGDENEKDQRPVLAMSLRSASGA
jgi:hypothetical protein